MPLFTPETAREARTKRTLYPTRVKRPTLPKPEYADSYVLRTLMRTRKQLRVLYDMLESETDPAKLDRIASAIEKLSRIEQNLAGRPGPGQYKPTAPPRQSHSQDVEPG